MRIKEDALVAVGDIQGELLERKALPIGRAQFDEWCDRIIQASNVQADKHSMKAVLAGMLMTIGPTEAFKEDGYYALALRVDAIKTTALAMRQEIDEARKARFLEQKPVADTDQPSGNVVRPVEFLENQTI